ncbi:hypothetical protein [Paenisporosarcina cavernae]|uniref:Nucleotide kinase n=1 Tax=Paenisporosarcina cavernae TaxID=2320858 RepID=A0A385YSV1_9BACL|nr:hypothetical protein [Paenisporosarcina cavernae]AYC28758.1 hypothetical protein D3873_02305 [Paenisporosarcina cavernae]
MTGTITYQYGRTHTGQGLRSIYHELIEEASSVYFIKSPPTLLLSELFRQIGFFYVKRGYDIEWFLDPYVEGALEAVFIRGCKKLFVQASYPISIEPQFVGSTHHILSFYEAYDATKLKNAGPFIREKSMHRDQWMKKFQDEIAKVKALHDEWEVPYVTHMKWSKVDEAVEKLRNDVFSTIQLAKKAKRTHRLLGSITPDGAKDNYASIAKSVKRRIYLKGYPGSGKSTLMKKIATYAESVGLDTQWGWCGLDRDSIDFVYIPELSWMIFDSTAPHEYAPERDADEVFSVQEFCELTTEETEKVESIKKQYKDYLQCAIDYLCMFVEEDKVVKETFDSCVNTYKWADLENKVYQML